MNINCMFPVCQLPLWWKSWWAVEIATVCWAGWIQAVRNLGLSVNITASLRVRRSHITRAGANARPCEVSQRLLIWPPCWGSLVGGKYFAPFSFFSPFPPPTSPPIVPSFFDIGNWTQGFTHARQELYHWATAQPENTSLWAREKWVVNIGAFPGVRYLVLSSFRGGAEQPSLEAELQFRSRMLS